MNVQEYIVKGLNTQQTEAVLSMEGPLLILAGAGSGKTRVLTHRVALTIANGLAAPDEILAVTFTNKAAREMEHRIFNVLAEIGAPTHRQLWISTFHSFCTRVLREQITHLGYKSYFNIYDSSDQLSVVKKVMNSLNVNDKMYQPKALQNRINQAKTIGLSPEKAKARYKSFADIKFLEVYEAYEAEMKKANSLDFSDLLMKVYELFTEHPDVVKIYQQKFKFILVDEYQDTNQIQYKLVKLMAAHHRNLCVVGDEDQSIYSWRGADITNILNFEEDFPDAKMIKLEENYRSTQTIVQASNALIKNNTQRKNKTLFTSNNEGDKIIIREEKNEYEEARFVAKTIQTMLSAAEGSASDYAIFYRTNAQSRVLEEQLRSMSIPYRIVGGVKFYDRMEIKDILGYLKLTLNPADDVAFKRIINVPARGIGKTTVQTLEEFAMQKNLPMLEAATQAIHQRIFNAGTTSKIRRFVEIMETLQSQRQQYNISEFYQIVLNTTEYIIQLKKEDTLEAKARIENLEELDNAITHFMDERGEEATLQNFLEEIALVSDIDNMEDNVNFVTMMTLHISKGLEYPYVFIVGLEENLFPSGMGSDSEDEGEVEEERRLAYVGMTRARQKLFMTYARSRRVWGQEQYNAPSRFIKEIPKEFVQFQTAIETPSFVSKYGQSGGVHDYSRGNKNKSFDSDFDTHSFPDYDEDFGSATSSSSAELKKGMRVKHATFGVGSVFQTEGSGDDQKITVLFGDNTIKKFVAKYARLQRV